MRRIRDALTNHFDRRLSNRRSAEILGLDHTTIGKYLARFVEKGLTWPLPTEMDDATLENLLFSKPSTGVPIETLTSLIDFAKVHEDLKKQGATLTSLHSEWLATVPAEQTLGYSQYCRIYQAYKNSLRISMRRMEVYGENTYVDYSGQTIDITSKDTGEVRSAQIFVGVLGGSNYTFCEATWTQRSRDWLGSHARMFEYFGGVSRLVVPDNLKAAVTKADRFSPVLNESYRALCRYYNIVPMPARAYKPKDKARAEGAVLLVQRWILFCLRKRKFFTLDEANREIRMLLEKLNHKPFQKKAGSRHSRWRENELPALQPLPAYPYEFAEWGKVRAGIDYHVKIDNHHYSVPHEMRGQELEYRITDKVVELLLKGKSVATHERSYQAEASTTQGDHRPPAHQAMQGWSQEDALAWASSVGSNTNGVMQIRLAQLPGQFYGYRATQDLKSLAKIHGAERLEEACAYALVNKLSKTADLRTVLDKRLDKLLAQDITEASPPTVAHQNIRGAVYYDRILNTEEGFCS